MNKLISKLSEVLREYESPILQDAIFLANYLLVCLGPKNDPLMKVLTGLELLLNKLEEWEVYASKRVGNSCDEEMTVVKQLIIRYRKL